MTVRFVRAAALAALVLTAACAAAPGTETSPAAQPAPAAASAAGTYSFDSSYQGQAFQGTIRLTRTDAGAYTGTVSTPLTGSLPVRAVDVQGTRIRVTAQGQMGDAVMNMVMNGDAFTGTWSYGPSNGQLTGRMRPAS